MDLKEKFIGNTLTMMSETLDDNQLKELKKCLVVLFEENDLVPHKDLPSEDVVDNISILKFFIATKKIAGLSDKSLKTYLYHINKFLTTCQVDIRDIDVNTIRKYIWYLESNTSNSYADDARRILNVFFSFCEDEEIIQKNPCKKIDKIKQLKTMKIPYSDTEVELIKEACITPREKALVSFLLSTGCRRDEVRQVKLSDINLNDRSVLIHGKGGKDRYVYISARCELCIRNYIESRQGNSKYLFCSSKQPYGRLTNAGLDHIIRAIGDRSTVPNVHLHRFRRWFATYMANKGVPIQDLKVMMGHEKLDTTNDYYIQQNLERIKLTHKNNCV